MASIQETCHKSILPNGVRILTEEISSVRSVAVGIWILAGSRNENPDEHGITHFIEHMLFKGTKHQDAIKIGHAFNILGGQFNAFTSHESMCLHARVVDHHLPKTLNLLAEVLLESVFPEEEIERERNVVLEEIKMCDDTPDETIIEIFQKNLWPDQAIGRPILGSPRTVRSMKRKDLLHYLKREIRPDRIVVSIAGNFKRDEVLEQLGRLFEKMPATPEVADIVEMKPPQFHQRIVRKNIEQVHFCLGTIAPPRSSEDRYAFTLLLTLLGGGMGSRLFQEVRERRGLAYSISTINSAFRDTAYAGIAGASSSQTIEEVLEVCLNETQKLYDELVPEDELNRTLEQITSPLLFGLESTMSRMVRLADCEYYYGRFIPTQEVLKKLLKVKPTHIREMARKYLKDQPLCAAALGPLPRPLKNLIPRTL